MPTAPRDTLAVRCPAPIFSQPCTITSCGSTRQSQTTPTGTASSKYISHPNNAISGVELNTGSLGHGLSLACGIALGAKLSGRSFNSYVLLGDGETDEGSVWEAALFASAKKLDNLYAIVDRNHFQITGPTEQVLPLEPYADKWRAFGFEVVQIDGNDMGQILGAFADLHGRKGAPKLIIADTVKGKGVSFMENNRKWHHGSLTDEQYRLALTELESTRKELEQ